MAGADLDRRAAVRRDDDAAGDLAGWIVVEGRPTMQTAVQHTTEDGKVLSGTWRATPGTYHATYTDYE
ncbi:hypothetical protein EN933_36550, partial [Mesorhizobium sp. M7A.F.Ca.US.001.01.1.1]